MHGYRLEAVTTPVEPPLARSSRRAAVEVLADMRAESWIVGRPTGYATGSVKEDLEETRVHAAPALCQIQAIDVLEQLGTCVDSRRD